MPPVKLFHAEEIERVTEEGLVEGGDLLGEVARLGRGGRDDEARQVRLLAQQNPSRVL